MILPWRLYGKYVAIHGGENLKKRAYWAKLQGLSSQPGAELEKRAYL